MSEDIAMIWGRPSDRTCGSGDPVRTTPMVGRGPVKLLVMNGGPDVGKTTIVEAILHILAEKSVPGQRMIEATGFEARTICRPLEVDPKGRRLQGRG